MNKIKTCDECANEYFAKASKMASLCPVCANILYAYPLCKHQFIDGRCQLCNMTQEQIAAIKKP